MPDAADGDNLTLSAQAGSRQKAHLSGHLKPSALCATIARLVPLVLLIFPAAIARAAPNASQFCSADKLVASSRFALCRLNAEARFAKNVNVEQRGSAYARCSERLARAYQLAEARYVGACLKLGDEPDAENFLRGCTDTTTTATVGAGFPRCGDGIVNVPSEQCDASDFGGSTCVSLGFLGGILACKSSCELDTSGCVTTLCGNCSIEPPEQCDGSDLGGQTCQSLGYSAGSLSCTSGCALDAAGCGHGGLVATGQTKCWDDSGGEIPCAGTGHDGELQTGIPLAFRDNGDGTIADLNTGLVWEKKSDDGSQHDKDDVYTWDAAFSVHIAALNTTRFAGYGDWRLPNAREIQTIVDYGMGTPAVAAEFNSACVSGCSVTQCSCTALDNYWSSTTIDVERYGAWRLLFPDGDLHGGQKRDADAVRAVRAGR